MTRLAMISLNAFVLLLAVEGMARVAEWQGPPPAEAYCDRLPIDWGPTEKLAIRRLGSRLLLGPSRDVRCLPLFATAGKPQDLAVTTL